MKKIFIAALMLLGVEAFAQGPVSSFLNRFTDPEKDHVVFLEKGSRSMGISGNFYSFNAAGYTDGDGFSMLSLLNMGDGKVLAWDVAPRISWFVADDLALGASILYNGYSADTDINLDFREVVPDLYKWLGDDSGLANVSISSRHMQHHNWGLAFTARKYISFFGSRTFGVFSEGRLFAKYGNTFSCPRNPDKLGKTRTSQTGQVGIDLATGVAVRLRDNSAITISIPIVGFTWDGAWQDNVRQYEVVRKDDSGKKVTDDNGEYVYDVVSVPGGGKMSYFRVSRATNLVDLIGIQFGYVRYIKPKKK